MTTSEISGQDQFRPLTNHRAGYGSAESRTAWVIDWLTRHPDATLSSGEGALLVARIRELEAELRDILRRNPDAPHTP